MSVGLKSTRLISLIRCCQASQRIVQPSLGYANMQDCSSIWVHESTPSPSKLLSYQASQQLLTVSKLFSTTHSNNASSVQEDKLSELTTEKDQAEFDKLYRSITLECRGHDKAVLASYSRFLTTAAKHLEICVDKIDTPRHHIIRYDTLKSAFVKKKHRVQYEIRTYFLIIKFLRLTSSTADTFLEYVQRNIPEGVAMIVTKYIV
ncbi:28S ribosomal protein S10, mitochondrial [Armadillidium nasatum]|uniref:Small ribosomal subunit protein uS10m n=1 Tax=Armadillidium nasatum TaxID=96803 RepID=A0A5N5SSE9_9CRUS|nr:28S ribosomal protein S10, mitochondrial [Armadillidium nasatum]